MPDVSEQFESGAWEFNDAVVGVFDEHVAANVPHYDVIQRTVAHLSDWLAPKGSLVADLGASTGTTADLIEDRHPDRGIRYALYDESQAMLDRAARKLERIGSRVAYHQTDITASALAHRDADLTLALFTLQFLREHERIEALRWARAAARDRGGVLLVAEKILMPSAFWQEVANEATWDFKEGAGIGAEAIRSKAHALRGVLRPQPMERLEEELAASGWLPPTVVWTFYQWVLIAALADETANVFDALARDGK